jgi:glutathione S-transferase
MGSGDDIVVVFDIPGKDGQTWSHHVLRILYSLHYKDIPYSIEGVQYPDIISTFTPTALEPKDDPIEPYEIPVLKVQTAAGKTQYYMEPRNILQALEELKPEPSLLVTSPRSVEFTSRLAPAIRPILQTVVGRVPDILAERSIAAFAAKRKARWGKSVEQWTAEHPSSEALAAAEPGFRALGEWLEEQPGPFVNGDKPGYADFTLASILGYAKAVGLTDVFEAVLDMHPAIEKLYSAVGQTQLNNTQWP